MAPKKRREEGMRKVPSVAPTMAIAPSDYEHIYHEGPAGKGADKKEDRSQKREGTRSAGRGARPANALPKLTTGGGGGGMVKVPSNAPTMAIAPSDYEHIYHQGQEGKDAKSQHNPPSPHTPPPVNYQDETEEGGGGAGAAAGAATGVIPAPVRPLPPMPQVTQDQVLATPDGYTMLGRKPDPNGKGQALPPHIVRANNQFSRAVLQRVSRFLGTKADPSYY